MALPDMDVMTAQESTKEQVLQTAGDLVRKGFIVDVVKVRRMQSDARLGFPVEERGFRLDVFDGAPGPVSSFFVAQSTKIEMAHSTLWRDETGLRAWAATIPTRGSIGE